MNKFQQLLQSVELFIKKYYKNQMVKGAILVLAVLLFSYLVVSGLEFIGRFGNSIRFVLLVSFVVVNAYLFIRYLIIPALKLNKLGRHMGVWEASQMIGNIFPDIQDKLKNTIQLEQEAKAQANNLELVMASIDQRAAKLSVVPFASAIDLKENKKYLKFLLPVLSVFILVAIISPQWFYDSTQRVINFNQDFVEPAPFDFILNSDSEVEQGEDYLLEIGLKGNEIPNEVKIVSNVGTYNLEKKSKLEFVYLFKNTNQDLSFYCEANGFKSTQFNVHVKAKPVIEDISLSVIYPKHTGIKPAEFTNSGDIAVPEGSIIDWNIKSKNLSRLKVVFKDTSLVFNAGLTESYSFKKRFLNSSSYHLITSSIEIENADTLNYSVTTIADEYPSISVEEEVDSMNRMRRFMEGKIVDDYGFQSLVASMKVISKDTAYTLSKPVKIDQRATSQLFSFYFDLGQFKLKPGERVEYYFSVTDNDEINDYKTTVSSKQYFEIPTLDELENQFSEKSEQLEANLDQAMKDAEKLKKEIENVKNNMMNKPNLDWRDKQSLENLLSMQKELNNKIEELKKQFEKDKNERENFLEDSDELKEKQKKLEELMAELVDEELLKLFEELEKLMNEMNKEKLVDNLEKMENKSETMNDELDRMLELFKNLELDQKLENLENQLNELAKEQDELNKLTEDKQISPEELALKQEEINKKFDEIQKDMDEIEKKNEELQKPRDIDFNEELEEGIDSETSESKENLEKNIRKKSQENQSKSSEMMKQMADDVSAMQSQMQAEQQSEDMDALRYLLENIVALSKRQEELMAEYKSTSSTDPNYVSLNRKELEIVNATQIVNDSLVELSKRVFQLSSFITEELGELNYSLNNALKTGEERKTPESLGHQQYAMTSFNELALMLSEVLDQMQKQAQSQMQGNGSCSNPGGQGQGKSDKMSMQQMKDAMQQQINKMKGGEKPGGEQGQNKEGNGGGQGPGSEPGSIPGLSSKEVSKMAAQQAQMRESLKQMREELNKDGSGAGNGLNDLIEDLDQLERDLINGNVGNDYLQRQQDIYTRLLENEKALRERGYSDERESKEGKNLENGNQIEFTEYNRKKNSEVEFLRSLPIGLQVYYKTLVNEYFNAVND